MYSGDVASANVFKCSVTDELFFLDYCLVLPLGIFQNSRLISAVQILLVYNFTRILALQNSNFNLLLLKTGSMIDSSRFYINLNTSSKNTWNEDGAGSTADVVVFADDVVISAPKVRSDRRHTCRLFGRLHGDSSRFSEWKEHSDVHSTKVRDFLNYFINNRNRFNGRKHSLPTHGTIVYPIFSLDRFNVIIKNDFSIFFIGCQCWICWFTWRRPTKYRRQPICFKSRTKRVDCFPTSPARPSV